VPAARDGLAGLLDLDAEEFNGNIEVGQCRLTVSNPR